MSLKELAKKVFIKINPLYKKIIKVERDLETLNQNITENVETLKQILYIKDSHDIYFDRYYKRNNYSNIIVCTTMICNQNFFGLPLYQYWMEKLNHKPVFHRKTWEWVYTSQTLYENAMLHEGKYGICFGCGKEPLISLFASMGCKILATDLGISNEKAQEWLKSNQHIECMNDLYNPNICDERKFYMNVKYRNVDMTNIPDDLGEFDFMWSLCALEHLGGYDNSFQFVINSLKYLKVGGIAVHTTEYNLSSNEETTKDIYNCIFRKKDIDDLISRIELLGYYVFPFDTQIGNLDADNFVDISPYKHNPHLRLNQDGYVTTSCGIIIKRIK